MEKKTAKEKIKYIDKLDPEHRKKYLTKLELINGFDPYENKSQCSECLVE
jgi:hypothetical protein